VHDDVGGLCVRRVVRDIRQGDQPVEAAVDYVGPGGDRILCRVDVCRVNVRGGLDRDGDVGVVPHVPVGGEGVEDVERLGVGLRQVAGRVGGLLCRRRRRDQEKAGHKANDGSDDAGSSHGGSWGAREPQQRSIGLQVLAALLHVSASDRS
jgi:hypothetical protein